MPSNTLSRLTRGLGHDKGSKIKSVASPPTRSEGKDGDMQIHNGHLYVKDRYTWHHFVPKSEFKADKLALTDFEGSEVSFSAYNSVTDADIVCDGATYTTIDFDTERFDIGNNFSGDKFVSPFAGKYFFTAQIGITQQDATKWIAADIVTTSASYYRGYAHPESTGDHHSISISCLVDLPVGDEVYVRIIGEGDADNDMDVLGVAAGIYTFFMGMSMGNSLLAAKINKIIELLQLDIK